MTPPALHVGGDVAVTRETLNRLSRGVFEVVAPKLEDDAIKYQDPLPFDLLPFAARNSRFWGRATAFAIAPNRFVTAAHVLDAMGTLESRYLRDAAGQAYEIGRILKFSQYRDLVEFELTSPPKDVVPLELARAPKVGDPVFSVGNALAEGIVLRGGLLTSFTPENMAGRWKDIRFSAAASPGNSGGPLVDEAGRVIGVVVRKSGTENLNYAIPIAELEALSATESEFWVKGVSFEDDNKQMFLDWRHASPLPSTLRDLRAAAQRSFLDFLSAGQAKFDAKYGPETFPRDHALATYLRNPNIPFGLGRFALDRSGGWRIAHIDYHEKEITPRQWVSYHSIGRYAQLIIARPRDVPLLRFFQSPKLIADTILSVLELKRPFAGKQIPIETLGEPQERERWVDGLGRPWLTSVWRLGFADESVVLDCLTNPGGVACTWNVLPVSGEAPYRMGVKRNASRTTLAYYGRIKDWIEFLALPEDYKPKVLAGKEIAVRFDKNLAIDIGGFQGSVEVPSLTDESLLYVYPSLDPANGVAPLTPRIFEVRVKANRDKAFRVGIERVFEPTDSSPEHHVQLWGELQKGEAPFNGSFEAAGKENSVRTVAKPDHETTPPVRYIYYCKSGSEDERAELEKTCASLNKSLKVVEN
jgi:hypothetical protein